MEDADMSTAGGLGAGQEEAHILNSVEQPSQNTVPSLALDIIKPDPDPDPDESRTAPSSSPLPGNAKMGKATTKKKGIAAAKKTPKKARAAKTRAAKKDGAGDDSDDDDDDETDNGPYCICRGPDDHRWMIGCEVCEDWFHGECIEIDKDLGEKLIERFVCPRCTNGHDNYTKYKKMCSLDGCTDPARLYGGPDEKPSVFCCGEHCDTWWTALIRTLPTKEAMEEAVEVLTQEDFMGLLASAGHQGGWQLGDKPFGNVEGLWANGLPTRPGVLSDEEQAFLQTSAAERLALGNDIVQYKKMMQLLDWASQRRQAAIELGRFTKDSCGYDERLDVVSVKYPFVAWAETAEGQAVFAAGQLGPPPPPPPPGDNNGDADAAVRGMCEKKRCKPHNGWYKILMGAVRVLVKETTAEAAEKLEAEATLRQESEARYERRQLENNWVQKVE